MQAEGGVSRGGKWGGGQGSVREGFLFEVVCFSRVFLSGAFVLFV